MRAVQFARFGGPEVLEVVELPDPVPGPGELLVDVEAAGINFADVRQVGGFYAPPGSLPHVPGSEVIGRTADGRRVMGFTANGYATKALIPEQAAVPVPETLGAGQALALLVQGLTAWHLLRSSARLQPGESVVVNSAAGGVGTLAVQLAKEFGAGRVIGTASSEEKRALVVELGADVAIDGSADGYAKRVIEANGGRAADIILDAVGGQVFAAAQEALAAFGRLIGYGSSSGEKAQPIDPGGLTAVNISVGGFWLRPLMGQGGEKPLAELFELTVAGKLQPQVGGEYALSDARTALTDLAGRRTVGKLVLVPSKV